MKILIAVLFWLLLLHVVNCQCRLNQTSEADCSQMKEPPTELPQPTLNSALKRLDISRNKVQKMGANFKKYTKLTTLIMRNVEYKEETLKREQWFADLKLLQELDITKLKYSNGELKTLDFTWPTSLVKLVVSNIGFETITGLKSLENLQELNATGNKLTLLPKLHPKSHIRSIFLENNPLEVIKVEEVAHLCFLKNLTIQIAPGGNFSTSLHHNCCKIFEKWMGQFRIQGHSSLTCSRDSPATQKSNCSSVTFPPEARALRDKCEGASLWDLLLYAVFFSIIFPILYFANETYNNYQEKTRIKQTKKPQLFTMTAESEQAVAQDSDHESQISTEDAENGEKSNYSDFEL